MEFGNEERPECNNLLSIYQQVTGKSQQVYNIVLFYSVCLLLLAPSVILVWRIQLTQKMYLHLTFRPNSLDGPENGHSILKLLPLNSCRCLRMCT